MASILLDEEDEGNLSTVCRRIVHLHDGTAQGIGGEVLGDLEAAGSRLGLLGVGGNEGHGKHLV
jgi:hypothetical protein